MFWMRISFRVGGHFDTAADVESGGGEPTTFEPDTGYASGYARGVDYGEEAFGVGREPFVGLCHGDDFLK